MTGPAKSASLRPFLFLTVAMVAGCDRGGSLDVWVMNADGTGQVRLLPESPGTSTDASWAPDGSGWVLSRKMGEEPTDVFIVDGSGAVIGRLTEDDASNGTAAFSPDGTRIAYYADRGDVAELVIAASDGSAPRTLLGHGLNYYPQWSPDGPWIVFTAAAASGQSNDYDVMAVPADGSGPPVILAGGPGRETEGRWRPRGEWAALNPASGPGGISSTEWPARRSETPTPRLEERHFRSVGIIPSGRNQEMLTLQHPTHQPLAPDFHRFWEGVDLPGSEVGRIVGFMAPITAGFPFQVFAQEH